uniref:Uncharacterized protein n=1 Tax=Sphaerodactylus townsendi TaxID=933632 RepID=A0ACB8EY08_9SAUR
MTLRRKGPTADESGMTHRLTFPFSPPQHSQEPSLTEASLRLPFEPSAALLMIRGFPAEAFAAHFRQAVQTSPAIPATNPYRNRPWQVHGDFLQSY